MSFIPMLDTVEVVLNWTWAGQEVKNVFHFQFPTAPSIDDMTELGLEIIDALIGLSFGFISEQASLDSLKITDMHAVDAPTITSVDGTSSSLPLVGSTSASSLPTNAALVVTHHTQNRGRSFRGRTYMPGLTPDDLANGTSVTSGVVTSVLGFVNAIVNGATTAGWTHVVASKRHNKADRLSAVLTPVTSYSCNADIDSQRRRLKGRGS